MQPKGSTHPQLCPDGQKSMYHGQTTRNLYTRGIDHEQNYRTQQEKSFMLKHQGSPGSYTANVNATAKDCLTRQVREAVHLRRISVPTLNGKTEWHQPALLRIQSAILRGWVDLWQYGCFEFGKCEEILFIFHLCHISMLIMPVCTLIFVSIERAGRRNTVCYIFY